MKFCRVSKRFDFWLYRRGKRAKFDNIPPKQKVIAFLRKNIQPLQICANMLIFRDIIKKSGEKVYFYQTWFRYTTNKIKAFTILWKPLIFTSATPVHID